MVEKVRYKHKKTGWVATPNGDHHYDVLQVNGELGAIHTLPSELIVDSEDWVVILDKLKTGDNLFAGVGDSVFYMRDDYSIGKWVIDDIAKANKDYVYFHFKCNAIDYAMVRKPLITYIEVDILLHEVLREHGAAGDTVIKAMGKQLTSIIKDKYVE